MNKITKIVINGQPYLLPAITVAYLEAVDDSDEQYLCTSHTAEQLRAAFLDGSPVMGLLHNQGSNMHRQLHCFLEGDSRVVFGDPIIDGGWQHCVGDSNYYRDENPENRVCRNEIWGAY